MILFLLAYVGGVLTIVSPCILPVLPFVFARAGQPFVRSILPLLAGMALTFAGVATLAAVGGGWAVAANQYGRGAALVLMGLFGVTLLLPSFSTWLTRPLVAAGNRLSGTAQGGGIVSSLLVGVATGLLWAPCAGPILGLVLTGALISGANVRTTLLLLAYAAGAGTSLAIALLAGGKVFGAMKRSLGAGEWVRRGLGVAVLVGVVLIALGLDTGLFTQLTLARTASIEQSLIARIDPGAAPSDTPSEGGAMMASAAAPVGPAVEGRLPALDGAVAWLNGPPLTAAGLRGKVVLIDFWTYSCINCLRALPYVEGWAEKYRDHGLVVIGIHAPEFAFEKDVGNVTRAVHDLGVSYPVAIDNAYALWTAFNNRYWPAHYFVDAEGRIRGHHFGEGDYGHSEALIRTLLEEAGNHDLPPLSPDTSTAGGVMQAADASDDLSPETYLGYSRATKFLSSGGARHDESYVYAAPADPALNQWGLSGDWTIQAERADLNAAAGKIVFRFHARDLHLVLGPSATGKPVRFRVTLDGAPLGDRHGADTDDQGLGTVGEHRLYQLVRQNGPIADHVFAIEFLDPGVQAYSFTFG